MGINNLICDRARPPFRKFFEIDKILKMEEHIDHIASPNYFRGFFMTYFTRHIEREKKALVCFHLWM